MTKFKSIFVSVLGDVEQVGSERYFVTVTCFITSIFLMVLCILHLIIHLKIAPIFIAFSSSIIILGLYFLARFTNYHYFAKVILTFFGLIMLDFAWYSKYLSNGPILYFIIIFGALIIWVWEGRSLAILLTLYFLNIGVLFVIDYNANELQFIYPNLKIRSIDVFSSFLIYSSLMIFLLYVVKREFIRQKDKAIKSDKLKSAFLANMSHEIRTPMNSIVGFSQLLRDETSSDDKQQFINIIQDSSNNLLQLINDIIDISKIEVDDMPKKYSNLSIQQLFSELKDYYKVEFSKRKKSNILLNFFIPVDDIIVHTDSLRLKQILSNLLNNAMKFTSDGTISVSCEKKSKELIFSVSDTGTGIPEENQKKIFERFVKFNYKEMNTEGSGIGLSIVEKLVTLLNGRIWLKSVFGVGSNFFFSLPYITPINVSTPLKSSPKKSISPTPETTKSILVVEDEMTSYFLIKNILEPLNIEMHHVTNGTDAISFIKKNPETQLILMDLKLPFMDGYQVTKAIKKINPKISIIAQTAYAMIGDRDKAISAGCDDYITKPIDLNKLQELVIVYLST